MQSQIFDKKSGQSEEKFTLQLFPIEIWAQIGLADIAAHWVLVRASRSYWQYWRSNPRFLHRLAQWTVDGDGHIYKLGKWVYQTVDGGPSVVGKILMWYRNGKLHREGAPAIVYPNGDQEWYLMGSLHRRNGPAYIKKGLQIWYRFGFKHRDDGPAIIRADGSQMWYLMDLLHRADGPAVIYASGKVEYWIYGRMQIVAKN